MRDDLDDLRVTLRAAADDFQLSVDPAAIARAGRRAQLRNRILGAATGVAVVAVAVGFGVPALRDASLHVPAVPAAPISEPPVDPNPDPTAASPASYEVDMAGWRTFASPEYPITFQYPADWTVDDDLGGDGKDLGPADGCTASKCVLFVNPPDAAKAAPLELIRSGFGGDSIGKAPAGLELLTVVPDLAVWTDPADREQQQAAVLRQPGGAAGGVDYVLGNSNGPFRASLSVGNANQLADHPETRFRFATDTAAIGGSNQKDNWATVVMILSTSRANPDFAPTRVP